MPKKKVTIEEEVDSAEPAAETNSVTVINANGDVVRHYSLAVHGEKFLEYAKEFCSKVPGRKLQ